MKFNENGKFRIMVIADIHGTYKTRPETLDLMKAALDKARPDLVVLTGDNIHGPNCKIRNNEDLSKRAILEVMQPITKRNIPFCIVFGNHDDEGGISKEIQMQLYRLMPGCMAQFGENVTGCGNYNIPLYDHTDKKPIFNLWFVDSGTYNKDESIDSFYAFVKDDQIKRYKEKSDMLKKENGGKPVPSFLFQHMPVTEIFDLLTQVPLGTKNSVRKHGKRYILNESLASGYLGEGPCPPDYNNGQFSAWKEQGDIVAAFFGHDHVNDFVGTLDGIDLVQTPGAGFDTYGNGPLHGVRIIDLDENEIPKYKTQVLYYKDLVGDKIKGGRYLWYGGQGAIYDRALKAGKIIAAASAVGTAALAVAKIIWGVKNKGSSRKFLK